MTRIALVDLGERLPIDLKKLAGKLNSLQQRISFCTANSITVDRIGDPDIQEEWYDFEALFDLLRHSDYNAFDYVIGLTHLKVTEKAIFDKYREKDYFCLSDFDRISVISLNRSILKHNSAMKTEYQYAAYCAAGELLINMAKQDLIHTRNNFCLFDDCVDRDTFSVCINQGKICEDCLARLKRCNVGQNMISSVHRILRWCSINALWYSLKNTLMSPIVLLFAGTMLGWLTSAYIKVDHYSMMILVFLFVTILTFLFMRYISKNEFPHKG